MSDSNVTDVAPSRHSVINNVADASPKRLRLTIIVSHPIQYYAPLYRAIAAQGRIAIHVIFLSDAGSAAYQDKGFGRQIQWDLPLLEGYDYTIVAPGLPLEGLGFWQRHHPGLLAAVERTRPDWILVHGYMGRMNWACVAWARRYGVKVAYTSDSNIHDNHGNKAKAFLKRIIVGWFFRQVDLFLSTSDSNHTYLRHFGASPERIRRLPFSIDARRFATGAPPPGQAREQDFVWAGKLIKIKRPEDFIAALPLVYALAGRTIRASLVGDGPLRDDIGRLAAQLPPGCELELAGFVNQSSMPQVLQRANTLVFTSSQEPYGLIATEAAAAGLALVVADRIGCVGPTGIARPDENTLIYPSGDVAALADRMAQLLQDQALLRKMQASSREIAADHDVTVAASMLAEHLTAQVAVTVAAGARTGEE